MENGNRWRFAPRSEWVEAFARAALVLAALFLLACGNGAEQEETAAKNGDADGFRPLNHPGLAQLEPKAKELIEAQRQALAPLADQAEGADPAKLGEAYGAMGMLYYSFRFLQEAEVCFHNSLMLQPDDFRTNYFAGHLYRELNDPEKASVYLQKAHELDPEYTPGMVALAQTLRQQDKQEQARALFQKAVERDPENAVAFMGLGHIASANKNYEEAIAFFGKALSIQARASAIHYSLALAYRAMENHEAAEKHMKLRGDIEPYLNDPVMDQVNLPRAMAHYRMAETLRLTGKQEDAIPHYALVIELLPLEPGPRVGRALNYIALGRYFDAAFNMQDDLTVFPEMSVMLHILARLSASSPDDRVRDGKRALQILSQLRKGGVTAEMTETLAMAFAEVGRFDDAVAAQQKAIAMAKEAGDDEFAARMQENLDRYRQEQPCRLPWPENDPLFALVTYGK